MEVTEESDVIFSVNLDRFTDDEIHCYTSSSENPVVVWLEEHVGPAIPHQVWPMCGENWKCWMAFNARRGFALSSCEVNFTSTVDESIISMFILRWL